MAKRLTVQDKILRLRGQGFSRKQLAESFGVSVSAIGRAERGQTKGETIKAQTDQFFKLGKKAKASVVSGEASLPSAKPKKAPAPKKEEAPPVEAIILDPFEIAERKLARFADSTKVVVNVNYKDGSTWVLFAKGGIKAGKLKGKLRDMIYEQAEKQGKLYLSDDIDEPEIESIDIEKY